MTNFANKASNSPYYGVNVTAKIHGICKFMIYIKLIIG